MQTAWPFRSTTSSTGQHASTCSIARLNPLVLTRSRTRYNMPPAVCFTREITTNNHDFSLGKTALGLSSNLTKRDRGTPVYRAKFEIQPTRWRLLYHVGYDVVTLFKHTTATRFDVSSFTHDSNHDFFSRRTYLNEKRDTPVKIVMSLSHSVNR